MKNTKISKEFGPWALITGASSGIGKEFAKQLASSGINLVLTARRLNLLNDLGHELQQKYNIEYHTIGIDLAIENSFDDIKQVTDKYDIGMVVSNAGTGDPGEFIHKNQTDMLKMINTSVITHLKIAHHYGNMLSKKRRGGIILVSAMGASHGLPYMANDSGTRAYIRSLGLGLNEEFKKYNVNMTVLVTPATDTPIVKKLGFNPDKMPVSPISAQQCVSETLKAFKKNKSIIIPGRMFRVMNKLIPDSTSRKVFGKKIAEGNGIKY